MSLWDILFGKEKKKPCQELAERKEADIGIVNEEIPGSLDIGWYFSENKNEFQMAKIPEKDRATHFYVIGASGSGKTKFLEFLIRQDIEKGHGFGVIDPHGDLIEDIKAFLALRYKLYGVEKEISDRLVLIDPTDTKFTVTFNPLEKMPGVTVPEQVNELVGAFRKIWTDSWGVRMEDLMRNSLIALGEAEFTLAELPAFLTKRAFREVVLEKVTHPLARDYFDRFDSMTDRGQAPWIEPVMNKINAFFADERIRVMFSSASRSSFNLREIMDQRKMLLVKLDKGRLKDSADLLGSLILAKIQMAAFSRADVPKSQRTLFHLFVDEFQNFASESFAVVLSEARKYGLTLVMAHQTLAQISPELRSLILGNAGIQVFFRVNRQDASLLAKEAFEYSGYEVKTVKSFEPVFWSLGEEWEKKTEELQNLSPRFCYVKHKIQGGIIAIQTAEIEPPWEELDMPESEFRAYVGTVPFGKKYLVARQELSNLAAERQKIIREAVEKKREKEREEEKKRKKEESERIRAATPSPRETLPEGRQLEAKEAAGQASREKKTSQAPKYVPDGLVPAGNGGSQHRYLQSLIKRVAEEKGFRAVVEEKTPDGTGSVDVGLSLDGKRLACEISVTTTEEHEVENIAKCLSAGYEKVILCSPERKALEKAKGLVSERIPEAERGRVLFLLPEDLFFFLEQEAAGNLSKEERVKGYKVKVQYQPVRDGEKKTKREAVGQVVLQALKRLKGGN